ncbi:MULTISPECIES: CBS domain-containing protein [Nostocales]|uniref:CBS domain-containing protein n=3 Tax=Nostocales TaxID=1161 RepID=A0A0C1NBA5_9CYAN|nr:CBS domain-containing protein [Tolypothrix bouteillei]KAF3890672.1 CBS domain-containing protein [Tolypothrix bouteillei VB521301]
MKHLKSRSQDLRNLFENSITIEYVAEPLKAVPADADVAEVWHWMVIQDFDVIGVESEGAVSGYLERNSLRDKQGKCSDYQKVFHPKELIAISTPLMKLLPILQQTSRLFVLDCNRVSGIVTYGDLQKAPVRMLLFGLLTLLEMNLLRLVRRYYSQDSWQKVLKSERVEIARRLWQESQERNEATDLLDYIQFCDKRELVLQQPELLKQLGLKSKRSGERFLKSAEHLRNRLAHAQDLVSGSSWTELISLAEAMEQLLVRCEDIE